MSCHCLLKQLYCLTVAARGDFQFHELISWSA